MRKIFGDFYLVFGGVRPVKRPALSQTPKRFRVRFGDLNDIYGPFCPLRFRTDYYQYHVLIVPTECVRRRNM